MRDSAPWRVLLDSRAALLPGASALGVKCGGGEGTRDVVGLSTGAPVLSGRRSSRTLGMCRVTMTCLPHCCRPSHHLRPPQCDMAAHHNRASQALICVAWHAHIQTCRGGGGGGGDSRPVELMVSREILPMGRRMGRRALGAGGPQGGWTPTHLA